MKTNKILCFALIGSGLFLLNSCKSFIADNMVSVKDFDADKYLGKWYEVARMGEFFERGLIKTTADYSLNPDGTIKVVNRGYNAKKDKWKQATGEAKFVKSAKTAELKVAFFKPFWAGYNVIDIDKDYQYALVAGDSREHLWVLSRTPQIPDNVRKTFLEKAESAGYNVSKLIWVEQ